MRQPEGKPCSSAHGHEEEEEYLSVAHSLDSLLDSWSHRFICLLHLQDTCSYHAEYQCIMKQMEGPA